LVSLTFAVVFKGWEQGLQLYSLGQRAVLSVPPEFAYGNQDIQGVIPANSTLEFDIELLNIYRPLGPVEFAKPHVHGPGCNH
jgi:FKBP-type peptidyl-prolyl cis-trans isomerase